MIISHKFPVHITLEEFKNSVGLSGFVFDENSGREITRLRDAIVFENLRFQSVFSPHENDDPAVSNSPV